MYVCSFKNTDYHDRHKSQDQFRDGRAHVQWEQFVITLDDYCTSAIRPLARNLNLVAGQTGAESLMRYHSVSTYSHQVLDPRR